MDTTIIKQSVTLSQACQTYGIPINRQGFSRCPFHSGDNTPSFKIYPNDRGFYCFGCGASGDVITFVKMLFNLNFLEAVKKLNADFSLGLDQKQSYAEYRKSQQLHKNREQAKRNKAKILSELYQLCTMHRIYWMLIKNHNDAKPDRLTTEAMNNIEYIRYRIGVKESELASLNC